MSYSSRYERIKITVRVWSIVTLAGLSLFSVAQAGTNYYVSEAGSDRNDGLSEVTPWKSLSKVGKGQLTEYLCQR